MARDYQDNSGDLSFDARSIKDALQGGNSKLTPHVMRTPPKAGASPGTGFYAPPRLTGKKDSIPGRRAEAANNEQKRQDDDASLKYLQFETLDKSQTFANAGDTMPVVFANRVNNAGGVWVSPPLIDYGSLQFQRTFVYLISDGQALGGVIGKPLTFIGKRALVEGSATTSVSFGYNAVGSCPISSFDITCDHTNFYVPIDSMGTSTGAKVSFRTTGGYATGVTIRAKPLHKTLTTTSALDTYDLTVTRYGPTGLSGVGTAVGTLTTTDNMAVSSISDSTTAGTYIYVIENNGINTAGTEDVETILLEIQQNNTWPESRDRSSSDAYQKLSLFIVEGNLYDIDKDYSDPSNLKQLHVFAERGVYADRWRKSGSSYSASFGPTDKFGDLLRWFFDNSNIFPDAAFVYSVSDQAIAAEFHEEYNMRFNGIIASGTNFLSWAQEIAPMFLCSFFDNAASKSLKPLLPLNSDGTIKTAALSAVEAFDDTEPLEDTLTNAIISGSYSKVYTNSEESKPFSVVVSWRGQDEYGMETTRTTKVRYSDYSSDVPEEAFDMTTFATNNDHVSLFAKYVLATRRYSKHSISFATPRNVFNSNLGPNDVISVSLNRVNSAGDDRTETDFYLVTSLTSGSDGIYEIEADHFPVDGSNASIISNSVVSGSFTVET